MYTKRRRSKPMPKLDYDTTLLSSSVGRAVHGRVRYLQELLVAYFESREAKQMDHLAELLLRLLGEIPPDDQSADENTSAIGRASAELTRSHRQFCAAMAWLCSSRPLNRGLPADDRLLESGKWRPGRFPDIDKQDEKHIRYLEQHGLRHFSVSLSLQDGRLVAIPHFTHVIDLFCAYLLDCCAERKQSEMPFKICSTCRSLFLSERKQFCSRECQWKSYWTPSRRADDKWVKDLEVFAARCKPRYGSSVADLRKKLARPDVVQRIHAIRERAGKEEWRGWAKILRRIEVVEKLSASRKKTGGG